MIDPLGDPVPDPALGTGNWQHGTFAHIRSARNGNDRTRVGMRVAFFTGFTTWLPHYETELEMIQEQKLQRVANYKK